MAVLRSMQWVEGDGAGRGLRRFLTQLVPLVLCIAIMGCVGPTERVINSIIVRGPHPTRVLVLLEPGVDIEDLRNANLDIDGQPKFDIVYDLNALLDQLYVVQVKGGEWSAQSSDAKTYLDRLRGFARPPQGGNIVLTEPDFAILTSDAPDAPDASDQWAASVAAVPMSGAAYPFGDLGLKAAWGITKGNVEIPVAVLDNGLYSEHPDLAGQVSEVVDIIGKFFPGNPDNHLAVHGTRVSSLVVGLGVVFSGHPGVSGVAPEGRVIPVRIMGEYGGNLGDALAGLEWAVRRNIRVSCNAWQTFENSAILRRAIHSAGEHGHLFVTVAGNSGQEVLGSGVSSAEGRLFPAAFGAELDNLVVVAASAPKDKLALFSGWDKNAVHLAAPGSGVLTAMPPADWSYSYGTSFAAPFVAGAVALALAAEEADHDGISAMDVTPLEMKRALMSTARPIAALKPSVASGGMLDIGALVKHFHNP